MKQLVEPARRHEPGKASHYKYQCDGRPDQQISGFHAPECCTGRRATTSTPSDTDDGRNRLEFSQEPRGA